MKKQRKLDGYSSRYINQLVSLNCAGDLLPLSIFPNAKEVTESFGAYQAVCDKLQLNRKDPSTYVVCIGDGRTPRTGATFAFRSKWRIASVDPQCRARNYRIDRLLCVQSKAEDWDYSQGYPFWQYPAAVVIVAVHSHANLRQSVVRAIKTLPSGIAVHVVAIPCCVPQELARDPDHSYVDRGIWSPANTVKVWANYKG